MANNVKYYRQIVLGSGEIKHAVNPAKYLKEAIGCEFEQYDDKDTAIARCREIDDLYRQFKRGVDQAYRVNSATVLGMINYYKSTHQFFKLAANSKKTYEQLLSGLINIQLTRKSGPFVEMLAANVTEDHADKLHAYLRDNISEHRARHTVKFLKRVWNVCEMKKKIKGNPWRHLELEADPVSDVVWKESQVDRFISTADEMGYPSMGTLAMLCYDLCQRPGDMRQLTWEEFDGENFEFKQEKTGVKIEIDASPRLIKRLVPLHNKYGQHETIVQYEKTNKGYDNRKYNFIAAKIRKQCMLPDKLKMKFLRHSGATVLGENGATEDQISAVTGHKSRTMLNIYVKKTKRLASSAQQLRFKENEKHY